LVSQGDDLFGIEDGGYWADGNAAIISDDGSAG